EGVERSGSRGGRRPTVATEERRHQNDHPDHQPHLEQPAHQYPQGPPPGSRTRPEERDHGVIPSRSVRIRASSSAVISPRANRASAIRTADPGGGGGGGAPALEGTVVPAG